MKNQESFTEETLKRIRTGEPSKASKKKRLSSRLILIIDGILVLLLLVYFQSRGPAPIYATAQTSYKTLEIRLSITSEGIDKAYLYSVYINNIQNTPVSLTPILGAVTLSLKHSGEEILRRDLSSKFKNILLKAEENKRVVDTLPFAIMHTYIQEQKIETGSEKKTLFQFSNSSIPLQAVLTFGKADPVSLTVEFKHEAQ